MNEDRRQYFNQIKAKEFKKLEEAQDWANEELISKEYTKVIIRPSLKKWLVVITYQVDREIKRKKRY